MTRDPEHERRARLAIVDADLAARGQRHDVPATPTPDPRTGAASPDRLAERAEDELERHLRYGRPFSVLALDVDRAHALAELHGEGAVPGVVRAACRKVRDGLRRLDTVGFGGRCALVVLLPETPAAGAVAVAERLRASLAATEVRAASGHAVRFTVSVGATTVEPGDTRVDDLLERALAGVAVARRQGGDRLVAVARELV